MDRIWYSPEEYDEMEDEIADIVRHMKRIGKQKAIDNDHEDYDSDNPLSSSSNSSDSDDDSDNDHHQHVSFCYRGLEWEAPKSKRKMNRRVDRMIDTVLREQRRQWNRGLYHLDDETVADKCAKVSRKSLVDARRRAIRDEQEIWNFRTNLRDERQRGGLSRSYSNVSTKKQSKKSKSSKTPLPLRRSASVQSLVDHKYEECNRQFLVTSVAA